MRKWIDILAFENCVKQKFTKKIWNFFVIGAMLVLTKTVLLQIRVPYQSTFVHQRKLSLEGNAVMNGMNAA